MHCSAGGVASQRQVSPPDAKPSNDGRAAGTTTEVHQSIQTARCPGDIGKLVTASGHNAERLSGGSMIGPVPGFEKQRVKQKLTWHNADAMIVLGIKHAWPSQLPKLGSQP